MLYTLKNYFLTSTQANEIFDTQDPSELLAKFAFDRLEKSTFVPTNVNNPDTNTDIIATFLIKDESIKEYLFITSLSKNEMIIFESPRVYPMHNGRVIKPTMWRIFETVIDICPEEIINNLLDLHAPLQTLREDGEENFLIHHITVLKKTKIAKHLLSKSKDHVNLVNHLSETPAHIAADGVNLDLFKLYVDKGCDLAKTDARSHTPLDKALRNFIDNISYNLKTQRNEFKKLELETTNANYNYDLNAHKFVFAVLSYCNPIYWPPDTLTTLTRLTKIPQISNVYSYSDFRNWLLDLPLSQRFNQEELNAVLQGIIMQYADCDRNVNLIVEVAAQYLQYGANLGNKTVKRKLLQNLLDEGPFLSQLKERLTELFGKSGYLIISEYRDKLISNGSGDDAEVKAINVFFMKMRAARSRLADSERKLEILQAIDAAMKFFQDRKDTRLKLGSLSIDTVHPMTSALKRIYEVEKLTIIEAEDFVFTSQSEELILYFSDLNNDSLGDTLGCITNIFYIASNEVNEKSNNNNEKKDLMTIKGIAKGPNNTFGIAIHIAKNQRWENILEKLRLFNFINTELNRKIVTAISQSTQGGTLLKLINETPINWDVVFNLIKSDSSMNTLSPLVNMPLGERKQTVMQIAASKNCAYIVDRLISINADINTKNQSNYNILHTAIFNDSYEFLEKFLQIVPKDRIFQLWHEENIRELTPYEMAFKKFRRGDSRALELYIKYTGDILSDFMEQSSNLSKLDTKIAGKSLSSKEAAYLLREYWHDLYNDNDNLRSVAEGIRDTLRGSLIANGELDATSQKYLRFDEILLNLEKNNSASPAETIYTLYTTPYGSGCVIFDYKNKPSLLRSFQLIKDFIEPAKATFTANYEERINLILYKLCQQKFTPNSDAAIKTTELINLFILCGATLDEKQLKEALSTPFKACFSSPIYKFYSYCKTFNSNSSNSNNNNNNETLFDKVFSIIKENAKSENIQQQVTLAILRNLPMFSMHSAIDRKVMQNVTQSLRLGSSIGRAFEVSWSIYNLENKPVQSLAIKMNSKSEFTSATAGKRLEEAIANKNITVIVSEPVKTFMKSSFTAYLCPDASITTSKQLIENFEKTIENLALHGIIGENISIVKTLMSGLTDLLREKQATADGWSVPMEERLENNMLNIGNQ